MIRRQSFTFLGFIALADLFFALSAGLLLLNPLQFEPVRNNDIDTVKQSQALLIQLQQVEELLDKLEADGVRIKREARDIIPK